ncbi:MAG TPA: glycosyltransferase family 4 protein [Thermodesulfovibrionales bacterium]|nr:glycosyltransferase family 4 protein [Thermodesulfovibrionales bacterium]
MARGHIVFLSHIDMNLYLFRLPLMKSLVGKGWKVTALVPEGSYAHLFEKEGIRHERYSIKRDGMNPLKEVVVISRLYRKLRKLRPDLMHSFTMKPNIYGSIAGKLAGVTRIVNSVTGLGSFFIDSEAVTPAGRALAQLYRLSCRLADAVVFQNRDDLEFFLGRRLVSARKCRIIRGSGVDLAKYSPMRFTQKDRQTLRSSLGISMDAVVVTLITRLIWDKGIKEFCEAAKIIRQRRREKAVFLLVGDYYDGNPNAVPRAYIESMTRSGDVVFAGWRNDIPAILHSSDIVTLPSYREGLPVSIQEALAMGLPVVTTDVPGCRETVEDSVNGLLVPSRHAEALAKAIEKLLENAELRRVMGKKGREKAEREFDVRHVIKQHIELYESLG